LVCKEVIFIETVVNLCLIGNVVYNYFLIILRVGTTSQCGFFFYNLTIAVAAEVRIG